ncbi:hypothetical protein Acy02nite_20880 [Actinoplanes cyaneus]|uniref:Uncharacterized protein n=1 Tax=Actinoplanes cyaneus TaxID=52696 RepID=A0A919M364_9ACTN|nr:hypothetical protein [Actinoplanes cyaneus]MCW2136642.1 hypothetical protein [Actinoplanes cyaneus]GID64207.1 hypothetical protein Acy02nite_20880 [Actinoplanes cyaneus]
MDIIAVNNFGDTRDGGLAGPAGLFLIVLMCIATVALIRNMNKRIRRLPDSFDEEVERARVAEIARLDADLEGSGGDVADRVEADRSTKIAPAAEGEVTAVPEPKHESASDTGRAAQ